MNQTPGADDPEFELAKARARLEVVLGLQRALDLGSALHEAIGQAPTRPDALQSLMQAPLSFSEWQAAHILDMTFGSQTAQYRERLRAEADELRLIVGK